MNSRLKAFRKRLIGCTVLHCGSVGIQIQLQKRRSFFMKNKPRIGGKQTLGLVDLYVCAIRNGEWHSYWVPLGSWTIQIQLYKGSSLS